MKRFALIAAALGLFALAPSRASAGPLTLNYSGLFGPGIFGPGTTLGGTPLPDNTPFTLAATFDSTADQDPGTGAGTFAATLSFDITGFGTFTSAPQAAVRLQLTDPTYNGIYQLGLLDSNGAEIDPLYSTASPPYSADSPSPSVLSGLGFTDYVGFFTTIPLAGAAGDLVVPNGGITFGPTATITPASVPEPSALLLTAVGLLGLGHRLRRK